MRKRPEGRSRSQLQEGALGMTRASLVVPKLYTDVHPAYSSKL